MRKPLRVFQFAAVNLLLIATAGWLAVACDGVRWAGPLDIDQLPGGFYSGSFTSTVIQPSPARAATGIVSEGFDAQFLVANEHYAGFVAVSGMALSGTLTEYSGRQGAFVGFDGTSTISLDGEVTEGRHVPGQRGAGAAKSPSVTGCPERTQATSTKVDLPLLTTLHMKRAHRSIGYQESGPTARPRQEVRFTRSPWSSTTAGSYLEPILRGASSAVK